MYPHGTAGSADRPFESISVRTRYADHLCLITPPTVGRRQGQTRRRVSRGAGRLGRRGRLRLVAYGGHRSHDSNAWRSRTSRLPTRPVEPPWACRAAGGARYLLPRLADRW